MFPPLIEKLVRHEDLTADEAAQVREVMEGRAAPGALAGLLAALVMKGERPGRDRGPRADDAGTRGRADDPTG